MEAFGESLSAFAQPGPDRQASGFVIAASNAEGTKSFVKAFGTRTLANDTPLKEDAVMWIASQTKIITAIAVLQCVQRNQFSLDDPAMVKLLLPELASPEVVSSHDPTTGAFTLSPAKTDLTLRQLLNHSHGMGYDYVQPALMAWRASRGEGSKWVGGTIKEAYETPFVADPGESWNYGPGFDWAGQMLERANNTTLGDYFEKHIFRPLGIHDMTFDLETRPDMAKRDTPPVRRNKPGEPLEDGAINGYGYVPGTDHFGGYGLYGTAGDFLKILQALLRNDGTLLSPEYVELLFRGSLPAKPKHALNAFISIPFVRSIFAPGLPNGLTYDVSFGGLVLEQNAPQHASKGTLGWVGVPNLYWVIDRDAGYCATFFQQLHPTGDMQSDVGLRRAVREALFKEFGTK